MNSTAATPATAPFTVVVAVDASAPSLHAFDVAARLVACMRAYRLLVVNVTALNTTSRFPYFDHLDKAYNLEIRDSSASAIAVTQTYLSAFAPLVNYDFVAVQGEGDVGPLLERYLAESVPTCDLVVVGTHNHQGLKKLLYGSVSEYCVAHLPYPVTVVKGGAAAIEALAAEGDAEGASVGGDDRAWADAAHNDGATDLPPVSAREVVAVPGAGGVGGHTPLGDEARAVGHFEAHLISRSRQASASLAIDEAE